MAHPRSRNRSRSKRRHIVCPTHGSYLDSVSQKYSLYASQPGPLQQSGLSRRAALTLVAHLGTVPLTGQWLEAFWCDRCQHSQWYHVRKTGPNQYNLASVPDALWRQAVGVILPFGNPSVGEFTRRQARQTTYGGIKDFGRIG